MNKEIKKQMREEFDELWKELRMKDNTTFEEIPADIQFKKLIDSLIDKTVQMTEEKIVNKITDLYIESDARQEGVRLEEILTVLEK